jgi:hypothetical protein
LGLVVAAFGELSPAFYELANAIERVRALTHLSYFACRKDHALEMNKQSAMRLILGRLGALVRGSAATTHGNAAGNVDDTQVAASASAGAVVVHEFRW